MKKVALVCMVIASISLFSCNAKTGKKAAEMGKKAYNEYKAFNKSNAGKYLRYQRYKDKLEQINTVSSSRICWQCQGWGVVGYVDSYGNFVTDYNGNIVTATCPVCNGSGITY